MMNCGAAARTMKWIRYSGWPLVFLLLLSAGPLYGQKVTLSDSFVSLHRAVENSHSSCLSPSFTQCPAAPQYDLIALRVSFQPDTSRFTTGNGTFEAPLFDSLQAKVDPLPHDAAYFDAHLQFLSNYIEQASDGNTRVVTHLIPEVIQLSGEMGAYSPTGLESDSDPELRKLASLVDEAWTLANTQGTLNVSGFNPATTAFVIFHAGVGRDIELLGTTLDKTPEDIPTIYFNQESLDRLLGQPISFKGLPVQHTMILPRTESRQGFDFINDEPFLVEFSINGLMAASFLNYLGVPDLFNTETGESAIGPFGLMDPLGLFAFNGLFPPEPSGWTKQYLGWAEPTFITGGQAVEVDLHAASGPPGQDLVRVPVSESEYFLLENRYRDFNKDGLVLTIYRDGATFEQRIQNGQEDFNSFNIDAFEGGVVVDVDDFDWALPGGIDEDDNPLVGGVLIWHIDEGVLADKLASNSVNSDPERRAVDLEEADSAQDLGFPSGSIFGPQAHLGTPFDFFYEGNPVVVITNTGDEISLYQNRFGSDTQPNSNTNAGGTSFVELRDFTTPAPTMSFTYARVEAESIQIIDGFPDIDAGEIPEGSYLTAAMNPEMGIFFLGMDELIGAYSGNQSIQLSGAAVSSPIVFPGDQAVALEAEADGDISLVVIRGTSISRFLTGVTIGSPNDFASRNALLYSPERGFIYAVLNSESTSGLFEIVLNSNSAVATEVMLPVSTVFSIAATSSGRLAILSENGVSWLGENGTGWNVDFIGAQRPGQLVIGEDNSGTVGVFTLPESNDLVFLQANGTVERVDVERFITEGTIAEDPILVDLDGDGLLEALVGIGNSLVAVTPGGALVDGFPLNVSAEITTQPIVATGAQEGAFVILVGSRDGQLSSFDLSNGGRELAGFPLAAGRSITATPMIDGNRIYTVSTSGSLSVWETSLISGAWWGMQGVDRFNSNFVRSVTDAPVGGQEGVLQADEVYNWPNPIRDGETFFRLTTSTDAEVRITIIDAAGTLVDRLEAGLVRAQAPVDIQWATDAGSGLYFARVEATDANGNSETTLIKMAVIR